MLERQKHHRRQSILLEALIQFPFVDAKKAPEGITPQENGGSQKGMGKHHHSSLMLREALQEVEIEIRTRRHIFVAYAGEAEAPSSAVNIIGSTNTIPFRGCKKSYRGHHVKGEWRESKGNGETSSFFPDVARGTSR